MDLIDGYNIEEWAKRAKFWHRTYAEKVKMLNERESELIQFYETMLKQELMPRAERLNPEAPKGDAIV